MLDATANQEDPAAWRKNMPAIMGHTFGQLCTAAWEEFYKAQDVVDKAVTAFEEYKKQGLVNKEAITAAYAEAMRKRGPESAEEISQFHARALACWSAWQAAESTLRSKERAMGNALDTLSKNLGS